MKKLVLLLILNPIYFFAQVSDFIHVDQFGYKPNHTKVAVISNPQTGFNSGQNFTPSSSLEIRNATTNAIVFTGSPVSWNDGVTHNQSGDKGWWFDFSSVTQTGDFYVYDVVNDERSAIFSINNTVYNEVLKAATKMFYYNRCGIEKITPHVLNGFADATSFTQDNQARDVYQQSNAATAKDMSGGWYDAGDYNKYVTFAERPVHNLLWAYRDNSTVFGDNWNIPESGNGIPDILDEIKWETDWLLKMVNNDGTVHIKIGSRNYQENEGTPPSVNTDLRYYAPVCTSAAIAASGMLAHTAKVFSQFSGLNGYALTLQDKAELAWASVLPNLQNNTLQDNCDDGSVKSGDADQTAPDQKKMAITAAIYLFDLTGDNQYHQYIKDHINDSDVINNNQWSNYNLIHVDALLYYTTLASADASLKNTIINSATTDANNNWNNYFEFNELDLYRAYANDWTYHWGSNNEKANFGNLNLVFNKYGINSSESNSYKLRAKEHLHYFHGVNPLSLVYLSNMSSYGAEKSANQIYHTWFADGSVWDDAVTSTYGPAPGFVPGGANSTYVADTSLSPPYNQPHQKSYLDFNSIANASWEITEPGIYYQATYVRLLAQIINLDQVTLAVSDFEADILKYSLVPNPSTDLVKIATDKTKSITLSIYNLQGQLIKEPFATTTNKNLNLDFLSEGIYFLKVKNDSQTFSLKFLKK
ncbi:glycoside hydrolase family 9 protein [Aureibaculum conchae]|uniref:glycoside hydrolase family 9 protein n=1 Tax=Aureibaculum sp. 2308TA14-22 TaxID=3108392 RepID=UPI003397B393